MVEELDYLYMCLSEKLFPLLGAGRDDAEAKFFTAFTKTADTGKVHVQ